MSKQPKFNIGAKVATIAATEQRTRATEQLHHPTLSDKPRGRAGKKTRTIPKVGALTVYLDNDMKRTLSRASEDYGIDKSDFIRVALREFFVRHTQETGTLDADSIHTIMQYVRDTTA